MSKLKIWLDDKRPAPQGFTQIKTCGLAWLYIVLGLCEHISFDHDLGTKLTGYDLAKAIEQSSFAGEIEPFGWDVHSDNPVGRKNIESAMKNADNNWATKRNNNG